MVTQRDLILAAREFIGVKFAHQGRSREGLDCLGLLLVSAAAVGLRFDGVAARDVDVPNYSMRPDTVFLQQQLERFLVPVSEAKAADVVLLEIDGAPQHLAILSDYPVVGELGMIHAYAVSRKVVEHRYDTRWQKATRNIYRVAHVI
jgi:hypothetical protein